VKLRFLSEARAELDDAALYYESARTGLGGEFLAEMDVALAFIEQFPDACPPSAHDCRHKKVHRFPYHLVFSVEDGEIVIVAVTHASRDPAYWHNRVL
jgi:toxin ParE1/3/4